MRTPTIAAICLLATSSALATTWTEPTPHPDPVRDGATCQGAEPMSYGSYIYQWPSKYDQVFWPLTDSHSIWFCRESGFAAFVGDFELGADERAALASHLGRTYQP